jgi:hypothetical protein
MTQHIMIDIEALGKKNAVILSIGAVRFDQKEILETLEVFPNVKDSMAYGLEIDADTLFWWLEQEKAAIDAWRLADTEPLSDCLIKLKNFCKKRNFECVWAKPPTYDLEIILESYRRVRVGVPWGFRQEACMRTALRMIEVPYIEPELKHSALSDAVAQAKVVQNILKRRSEEL